MIFTIFFFIFKKLLLRKKAAEELKKEQERKSAERRKVIDQRCGKATSTDGMSESTSHMFFSLEQPVTKNQIINTKCQPNFFVFITILKEKRLA